MRRRQATVRAETPHAPDGALSETAISARDLSERQRAYRAESFLAEATEALSSSLHLETTLQTIAGLAVPDFGDWALVYLLGDDGGLRVVGRWHSDPGGDELLARLAAAHQPRITDESSLISRSIRDGAPVLRPLGPDFIASIAHPEIRSVLADLGAAEALIAPLIARGDPVGAVALFFGASGRRFDERDRATVAELARRAAIAVDNARLYRAARDELAERRRMEDALRVSEERYRHLVEHMPAIRYVAALDDVGSTLYMSQQVARVLGYTPEEMVARPELWRESIHPEDRQRVHEAARRAELLRQQMRVEYRSITRGGRVRWLRDEAEFARDRDGHTVAVEGVVLDITDLKEVEAALERRSAELNERVKELRCLYSVSRILDQPELPREERLTAVVNRIPEAMQYPERARAHLTLNGERFQSLEACATCPPATLSVPITDDFDGELTVCYGGFTAEEAEGAFLPEERMLLKSIAERIVTTLKLESAQAELVRSEAQLRAIIENATDVIAIVDETGTVVFESPSSESVFGHRPHDVEGTHFLTRVHPDDKERVAGMMQRVLQEPRAIATETLRMHDGEGSWRYVESTGMNLLQDPHIRGIVVNTRDVTDRVRAEEQSRFQASLLAAVGQAVLAVDERGTVTYWNDAIAALCRIPREEAVGRDIRDVLPASSFEPDLRGIRNVLESSCSWHGEIVLHRGEGDTLPLIVSISAIRGASGDLSGVVAVASDLTETKRLESELRQSQKMEAVGRLAGGIAHDFNNLLTAIKGHAEFLISELPADGAIRDDALEIRTAANRAANLTRQLLAFSRKQVLQPKVLELNAVVRELERMLRRLIGEDIHLLTQLEAAPSRIRADPSQIEQVVLNLVVNAREAMPDGGTLTVTTRAVELDTSVGSGDAEIPPGSYIVLSVQDTGVGMDESTLSRVFEPFFTTKEGGTGLGLATVYGIARQSGGNVIGISEPGRGSTMSVYLPREEQELPQALEPAAPVPEPARQPATGTILLVEDEDAVRALVQRILVRNGYRVLSAGSGAEALAIADAESEPIDLLLTDVIMPGMSGREVAIQLSARRPTIGVVFTSGYNEDAIARQGVLAPGAAFLAKPFTPDELITAVHRGMETAHARAADERLAATG